LHHVIFSKLWDLPVFGMMKAFQFLYTNALPQVPAMKKIPKWHIKYNVKPS